MLPPSFSKLVTRIPQTSLVPARPGYGIYAASWMDYTYVGEKLKADRVLVGFSVYILSNLGQFRCAKKAVQ